MVERSGHKSCSVKAYRLRAERVAAFLQDRETHLGCIAVTVHNSTCCCTLDDGIQTQREFRSLCKNKFAYVDIVRDGDHPHNNVTPLRGFF